MATVLYDSDCGFCRWAAAKVVAWDRRGRLRMAPLQDRATSDRLLENMPEEVRMGSWHLVEGGYVYSGGEAFSPLLRLLPGGGLPARIAAALQPLTNRAYRFVASRRTLFGRFVTDGAKRRADARLARRAPS